jgi:hypothetical protein
VICVLSYYIFESVCLFTHGVVFVYPHHIFESICLFNVEILGKITSKTIIERKCVGFLLYMNALWIKRQFIMDLLYMYVLWIK